jgi:hypothetical protein
VPSVASTSPCGEVSLERPNSISCSRPEHPLRRLRKARLVMACGPCSDRYSSLPFGTRPTVRLKEMPLSNFCSRLVVTRIRQASNSQACGLHRFDLRDLLLPPRSRVNASAETEPSTTAPNSRLRHLRPRVAARLTACRPAAATFPALGLPKGLRSSRRQLASALSAENQSGEATANAPCRNSRSTRLPGPPKESQSSSPPRCANSTTSSSPGRLPSAGPTGSARRSRSERAPVGRH